MHGPPNVKFANAKRAKQTYQYNQNNLRNCASSWLLSALGEKTT